MKTIGFFNEVAPGQSGGKGKNLIQLQRASFPVPPGFILTYGAYSRFSETGRMSREMKETISTYYRTLSRDTGNTLVAVRSSASAEDLKTASFAGLYDTYLYVESEEMLCKRIADCWHSLFSERAAAYRQRMNIPGTHLKMAVIVQAMIDPKSAGILFTGHPYRGTGNKNEMVMMVESNWGCGETVVSGKVTPDRFVISKNKPYSIIEKKTGEKDVVLRGGQLKHLSGNMSDRQTGEFSLTDNEIKQICRLGNKIESHFGLPQDIEWAITDEGRIVILQSRPVTA